jgi:hypothetical protein
MPYARADLGSVLPVSCHGFQIRASERNPHATLNASLKIVELQKIFHGFMDLQIFLHPMVNV